MTCTHHNPDLRETVEHELDSLIIALVNRDHDAGIRWLENAPRLLALVPGYDVADAISSALIAGEVYDAMTA